MKNNLQLSLGLYFTEHKQAIPPTYEITELCVILDPWIWCISFKEPGILPKSIYSKASQPYHILCWNRKQPNCRPLQSSMQTDRAKYIQGQAAPVNPKGTSFPFTTLYIQSNPAGTEQPHLLVNGKETSECYSYLAPALRNSCKLFKSFNISLITSLSISSSSGTQ